MTSKLYRSFNLPGLLLSAGFLLGGCAGVGQPGLPQPGIPIPSPSGGSAGSTPSMPSSLPPSGGQSGSSGSSSSQPGSSGQSGGSSGGQQTPGGAQGGASSGGDSPGQSSPGSDPGQANNGGTPTDLEVLEPEPTTSTADASDGEPSDAAGGGGEQGETSNGAAGGGQGDEAVAGGPPGGGGTGGNGSLDEELDRSIQIFEDGVQQQIIVIASSMPGGDGEFESGSGRASGGGLEGGGGSGDQTGTSPELIIIEGDVSQLPTSAGSGSADANSGVVTGNETNMEGPRRSGDNKVAKILVANIPEDVGDGSDDDVVARQIREAATNEKDPALREKLWEEYRNYKKSLKTKKF